MELKDHAAVEAEFARRFGRLASKNRGELNRLLERGASDAELLAFWKRVTKDTEDAMAAMVLLILLNSSRQHLDLLFDKDEATRRLTDLTGDFVGMANSRARWFADHYVAHGQDILSGAAAEAAGKTAGETTARAGTVAPRKIFETTAKIFGPSRIAGIARTEVTNAASRGASLTVELSVGLSENDIWKTSGLENVCPVCQKLEDTPRSYWSRFFPGGPEAHVNCACYIQWAFETQPAEVVAESIAFKTRQKDDKKTTAPDADIPGEPLEITAEPSPDGGEAVVALGFDPREATGLEPFLDAWTDAAREAALAARRANALAHLELHAGKPTKSEEPFANSWLIGANEPQSRELMTAAENKFGGAKFTVSSDAKRAMNSLYSRTQSTLEKAGIDHITLYRGIDDAGIEPGTKRELPFHALSSWTPKPEMALAHAKGGEGRLLRVTVPREKVAAFYGVGFGSAPSHEFVLHVASRSMEVDVLPAAVPKAAPAE